MNKTRKTIQSSEDVLLLAKFVSERDEDAFAQIVRKYESLVWNICCRILHNRCDAEDAFQSTFLLLATKAHRIRKPRSLSSWLYGVAFRTASSIRKQRQRGMLPYETTVDRRLTEDVLDFVARKNENELVSAEIMLMKEKHKTPLLMFYFLGNSANQIANTLGLTKSAVEGRLREARRTLKLQLRLRGVDFNDKFAALIVPVMIASPSLKYATISNAMAASLSTGISCLLSNISFGSNQIGARLMLTKIAVSFGLVCVASTGLLHHGNFANDNGQIVQVDGDQADNTVVTIPIKFVQEEEDAEETKLHEHAEQIHKHLYGMYQNLAQHFFDKDQFRLSDQEIEVEILHPDVTEIIELKLLHDIELKLTDAEATTGKAYRAVLKTYEDLPVDHVIKTVVIEAQAVTEFEIRDEPIPFLSNVPYIGRLFKNVSPVRHAPVKLKVITKTAPDEEIEFAEVESTYFEIEKDK